MSMFFTNLTNFLWDTFLRAPFLIFLCVLLFFFTFIGVQGRHIEWIGDYYIYLEVAQNIFSGGILYQSVIDTKNMGFFFFFYYFFYKPYALIFATTEYLPIWHGIFLSFIYASLNSLIYHILRPIYGSKKAFISVLICFAYLIYPPHSYFINQPQIAVCFHLFLLYYILNTYKIATYLHYFVYGVILGLCFSVSSPYAILVLSIPTLALRSFFQDRDFNKLVFRGLISFCGFILSLLPFFLYFYYHDALFDWWYWNYEFVNGYYSSRLSTYDQGKTLNFFLKFLYSAKGILGGSIVLSYLHIPGWTAHILIYFNIFTWFTILYQKLYHKKDNIFSEDEIVLFALGGLSLFTRLCLIRNYSSYNLYIIPIVILQIPMVLKALFVYLPNIYKIYKYFLLVMFCLAFVYSTLRYSIFSTNTDIPLVLKELTLLNPHKSKSTVMLSNWSGYTYSTRWKHVYHNFYGFIDYDFEKKVYDLEPEILIVRKATRHNTPKLHPKWDHFLEDKYKIIFDINLSTPNKKSFFAHDTDAFQGKVYIRKDELKSWHLPDSEFSTIYSPVK